MRMVVGGMELLKNESERQKLKLIQVGVRVKLAEDEKIEQLGKGECDENISLLMNVFVILAQRKFVECNELIT